MKYLVFSIIRLEKSSPFLFNKVRYGIYKIIKYKTWNSVYSVLFHVKLWYNIHSKKTNEEVRNLDEKEMRDTVENIIGIKIDNNEEKRIEDEVKEILNIKGE